MMRNVPVNFRALSARLGNDPLQVQGPGGNTSIKANNVMWIKASGTELADAETREIFVAVDRQAAKAEAEGAGDGTCKATVLDPESSLRPSIETTFHAYLDWPVVVHTHSIATIVHAISKAGQDAAREKLAGLPVAFAPYRKPGVALTAAIIDVISKETKIVILQNHGLVCAGNSVNEVSDLIAEVESRLHLPAWTETSTLPQQAPPDGYEWFAPGTSLATDSRLNAIVRAGSYYPDHVVFLGAGLAASDAPAILVGQTGVALKADATSSQRAMIQCLTDVLLRLPIAWSPDPIGPDAEAELLDWDAEKYRQALAANAHD